MLLVVLALLTGACRRDEPEPIIVYTGRSQSLVDPIIEQYRKNSGADVTVRYAETADLAKVLVTEDEALDADLIWAEDAGALAAADEEGLLATLPDSILYLVHGHFRSSDGTWVATTARARTLAYSPERVDTSGMPNSLFDLTAPAYRNRVGWAPRSGGFQSHVTAIRVLVGDDSTESWLRAMKENGTRSYKNDAAVVQALADGGLDFGLVDHSQVARASKDQPDFPVRQAFFAAGDPGNLIGATGVGVLDSSRRRSGAIRLAAFLLSQDAQRYFASETFEYPVAPDVDVGFGLPQMSRVLKVAPGVDLNALTDHEGTLAMLAELELL